MRGKYAECKYPNLIEIYGDMPTDYFAEVTPELMLAVFRGEEDLTMGEISRIAHYNNIPLSVLICHKKIMLDVGRRRHKRMIAGVNSLYIQLRYMAREGSKEAEKYLKYADREHQEFLRAVQGNELSYGRYLAVRGNFLNYVRWSMPKPKKRDIQR